MLVVLAASCSSAEEKGRANPVELYARGDYSAVVAAVEPRHREGKAGIQESLLLARSYLHLGRQAEALAVARAVLSADAENPEANGLAGTLLHRKGEDREAVDFLLKAHRLKPQPSWAVALGECYHALGKDALARRYLEEALRRDARNPEASFLLGRICLKRGYGALAEKYLLLAREAGKRGTELTRLLGKAFLLQRKLIGPVRVVRLPGKHRPGEAVEGHLVLEPTGDGAYRVCSRFSALGEGLELLRESPKDPDALEMVARGWLAAGRADLARKAIESLAAIEPQGARAIDLRARLLLLEGKAGEVAALARSAVARKALGAERCCHLVYRAALAKIAEGRREEARRLLEEAEAICPTSLKVLRSLAELARASGRRDEARHYYRRLIEFFPDSAEVDTWRNLALVVPEKGGAR